MLVIGLTGGIASGKSTVSQLFASHGIPIIDADLLARRVVEPGTSAHSQILATFGSEILLKDGSRALDRKRLGEIIFTDERKRAVLNGIVHPAVRRELVWDVARYWLAGHRMCIVDVPLLIESKLYHYVSKVVVVYCSKEIQLQRLMARDKSTKEAAQSRLNAQLPLASKLEYADHVLDNSGALSDLDTQLDALVLRFTRHAGWTWVVNWLVPPIGLIAGLWRLAWRNMRMQRRRRARRDGGSAEGDVDARGDIRLREADDESVPLVPPRL